MNDFQKIKKIISIVCCIVISTCLLYASALTQLSKSPLGDWEYFKALSLLVKSNVLQYHSFPLHNPWACGGMDLLANPQNRIFSPFLLFDIFFNPYLANLFSMMFYSAIGLWGGWLFFRRLGRERLSSVIGAFVFIASSWFGLHLAEGHVTFASLQLLPLILYLVLDFNSKRRIMILFLIHAFLILDGGVYSMVISFYAILTCFICQVGNLSFSRFRQFFNEHWKWITLCGVVALAFVSLKIIPMLSLGKSFVQNFQTSNVSFLDTAWIFFSPFQNTRPNLPNSFVQWRTHEFGCYLGFLLLFFFIVGLRKKELRPVRIVLGICFWFWTGLGWGGMINPWTLHEFGPFSDVHVQSRMLIIGFILILPTATLGIDHLEKKLPKWIFVSLIAVLMVEFCFVRNYAFYDNLFHKETTGVESRLIQNNNLDETIKLGWMTSHYFDKNKGSKNCYEPSFAPRNTKYNGEQGYKGEIYLENENENEVALNILSYTPGKISGEFSNIMPGNSIVINTNSLGGWKSLNEQVEATENASGLLHLRVKVSQGEFKLEYAPKYRRIILIVGLFAFWGSLLLFFLSRKKSLQ